MMFIKTYDETIINVDSIEFIDVSTHGDTTLLMGYGFNDERYYISEYKSRQTALKALNELFMVLANGDSWVGEYEG